MKILLKMNPITIVTIFALITFVPFGLSFVLNLFWLGNAAVIAGCYFLLLYLFVLTYHLVQLGKQRGLILDRKLLPIVGLCFLYTAIYMPIFSLARLEPKILIPLHIISMVVMAVSLFMIYRLFLSVESGNVLSIKEVFSNLRSLFAKSRTNKFYLWDVQKRVNKLFEEM